MTIRSWTVGKLAETLTNLHPIELVGEHGLRIRRSDLPTAFVYCVEPSDTDRFTADDLRSVLQEMPDAQFVVLTKRDAENAAYAHAEEAGVCLSSFGDLRSALANDANIAKYRSREQIYLLNRLKIRHVDCVRRCGKSAYEISRTGTMSTVNIVTISHYELTADSVYELLDENENIDIHAIVTTNPNCRGFPQEVLLAGRLREISILTLTDLLKALGEKWT